MEEHEKNIQTYLTFRLGDENFAANIDKAIGIIEMTEITKVPHSPEYMKGIINMHGKVLPVIDTRMKFGMSSAEYTKRTVIVVFRVEIDGDDSDVGAIIDEPGTVLELTDEEISPAPNIGAKYKSELVMGVIKINDEFIQLLNIDKVFSLDELLEIQENTEKGEKIKEEEKEKKHEENNEENNKKENV